MNAIKRIILCGLLITISSLNAQEFKETITKTLNFSNANSAENLMAVFNIYGSIEVETHSKNSVEVSAKLKLDGNNPRGLELAKKEVQVAFAEEGDIIYAYVTTPNNVFNVERGAYNWNNNNWQRKPYDYHVDFHIKVPQNTSLELSAINDGEITVTDVQAKYLVVKNINGGITMNNVAGKTYVDALNRDINISYAKNPTEDSTFKSLNGDITVSVQKGLNADVSFKSLNGNIYTNLETENKPLKVERSKSRKGNKTKYKVNANTSFVIGKGGVQMDFDLLNGDATIKE